MSPGINNLGNGNQIRDGLEPCPFCGTAAEGHLDFEDVGGDRSAYIRCPKCDVSPDGCYRKAEEAEDAVRIWNTRVTSEANQSEPCPRDELVERVARAIYDDSFDDKYPGDGSRDSEWCREWSVEAAKAAIKATRIEANQSSLDTVGGRIEELEELLERVVACRMEAGEGRFVNLAKLRALMPEIDEALRGPVSRSHASHQAPVGLGRSGFDRGQSK